MFGLQTRSGRGLALTMMDAGSYQIPPRLLLIVLRLKLVNLEKALKSALSRLTDGGQFVKRQSLTLGTHSP